MWRQFETKTALDIRSVYGFNPVRGKNRFSRAASSPRTRPEAQQADDYRYADVTMGQELREARSVHSAAFWCITFISPRGTLVRDATMRSDTSSLFVVTVQENLTTHLRPYEYGIPFVPKDPSVSRARFDRSKLRPTTRGNEAEESKQSRSANFSIVDAGSLSCSKCSSFVHRSRIFEISSREEKDRKKFWRNRRIRIEYC